MPKSRKPLRFSARNSRIISDCGHILQIKSKQLAIFVSNRIAAVWKGMKRKNY